MQGAGESLQRCSSGLAFLFDDVDQNFGIRLGREAHAFGLQLRLAFLIVFDDPVVHDAQTAGKRPVRVGVGFRRRAVGGPTGVAHAGGRKRDFHTREFFFQAVEFAFGSDHVQFVILGEANPRGVIPAVFKAAQAFHHKRNSRTPAGVSNNAAHGDLPSGPMGRAF